MAQHGQHHHRAVLTDAEVESLLREREDGATYLQLAMAYGVSKSCVADICKARRRAVPAPGRKRGRPKINRSVRVNLRVSLRARAILHRLGGGEWIEKVAVCVDEELARIPSSKADDAWALVLKRFGVTESRALES